MPDTQSAIPSPSDVASQLGLTIPPDYSSDVAGVATKVDDLSKKETAELEPLREKKAATAASGEAASDDAFKKIEPFKPLPAPDQRQSQTDPLQTLFSFGSVFGILASAFTHQPWQSSFDAAAAAINARNQGDADAYDHAFKEWQANTKVLFDRHQSQMDDWKDIQEKTKGDLAAEDAAIQAHAAKYDDQAQILLRQAGLYGQAEELMTGRNNAIVGMMEQYPKVVQGGIITSAVLDLQVAQKSGDPEKINAAMNKLRQLQEGGSARDPSSLKWQVLEDPENKDENGQPTKYRYNPDTAQSTTLTGAPYTPSGAAKLGQNQPSANDPDIQNTAKMIAEYKLAPPSSVSMGRPYGKAIMSAVSKINPDYDASSWQEKSAAVKAFGAGPLGNQTRSFSVGLYHLDTMQKLSDALKNGDTVAFNKIANAWAQQTGSAAPTNFETAKQIIGAEVVKAIVGAGGGGVAERMEAANHIASSLSPEQLKGAIDTTKSLMVGQLKGLKSQYERTTKLKNFEDDFLSPEAKELFDRTQGETGGTKYTNGQIIERGGKKYRVTGGDMSDPDVEIVK